MQTLGILGQPMLGQKKTICLHDVALFWFWKRSGNTYRNTRMEVMPNWNHPVNNRLYVSHTRYIPQLLQNGMIKAMSLSKSHLRFLTATALIFLASLPWSWSLFYHRGNRIQLDVHSGQDQSTPYTAAIIYLASERRSAELVRSLTLVAQNLHTGPRQWPIILFHTGDFDHARPRSELLARLETSLSKVSLTTDSAPLSVFVSRIYFSKLYWSLPEGISDNVTLVDPVQAGTWPGKSSYIRIQEAYPLIFEGDVCLTKVTIKCALSSLPIYFPFRLSRHIRTTFDSIPIHSLRHPSAMIRSKSCMFEIAYTGIEPWALTHARPLLGCGNLWMGMLAAILTSRNGWR
jgi:hypothetical protein